MTDKIPAPLKMPRTIKVIMANGDLLTINNVPAAAKATIERERLAGAKGPGDTERVLRIYADGTKANLLFYKTGVSTMEDGTLDITVRKAAYEPDFSAVKRPF